MTSSSESARLRHSPEWLKAKADQLRKAVVAGAIERDWGHVASSLSTVTILTALYYKVKGERDHVIVSKGHGCYGLYAILADIHHNDSYLWPKLYHHGCCRHDPDHRVLGNTGSLGHGLPFSVGLAVWERHRSGTEAETPHVWCIVGDGELDEGSCAEAIRVINRDKVTNISVVCDGNGLSATRNAWQEYDPFSWIKRSGDDPARLADSFETKVPMYWVETVKGDGVPFMEGKQEYHFRRPSEWTTEEKSWIDSWLHSRPTADAT